MNFSPNASTFDFVIVCETVNILKSFLIDEYNICIFSSRDFTLGDDFLVWFYSGYSHNDASLDKGNVSFMISGSRCLDSSDFNPYFKVSINYLNSICNFNIKEKVYSNFYLSFDKRNIFVLLDDILTKYNLKNKYLNYLLQNDKVIPYYFEKDCIEIMRGEEVF